MTKGSFTSDLRWLWGFSLCQTNPASFGQVLQLSIAVQQHLPRGSQLTKNWYHTLLKVGSRSTTSPLELPGKRYKTLLPVGEMEMCWRGSLEKLSRYIVSNCIPWVQSMISKCLEKVSVVFCSRYLKPWRRANKFCFWYKLKTPNDMLTMEFVHWMAEILGVININKFNSIIEGYSQIRYWCRKCSGSNHWVVRLVCKFFGLSCINKLDRSVWDVTVFAFHIGKIFRWWIGRI